MLRQLIPPVSTALPVAELADHLRLACIPGALDADAPSLVRSLETAAAEIETALSTALLRSVWEFDVAAWPEGDRLPLPLAPALEVHEIRGVDIDGLETVWDPAHWRLEHPRARPAIRRRTGAWPGEGGRVVFAAGRGEDWTATPPDLRQAVLLLAAHRFEHRAPEADSRAAERPIAVEALLAPYRALRL